MSQGRGGHAVPTVVGTASLATLSKRGQAAIDSMADVYYFPAMFKVMAAPAWSPEHPDRYIALAVAENRLSSDMVRQRMQQVQQVPPKAMYYDQMRGIVRLRTALAKLLERTFMKGLSIDPNQLVVLSGCGAVLDNLFWILAEPGEAVLVPAPYYPGFDHDMRARGQLKPWPVFLPKSGPVGGALRAALAAAAEAGHPVRALLLTNPNNPLGIIYPEEMLHEFLEFALENRVHIISDEVYANSIFKPAQFVSMAHVAAALAEAVPEEADAVAELVHVVFGLSKDFDASGLRVGAVYTHHTNLLKALDALSYFASVSNYAQNVIAEALEDTDWLDAYLQENNARLGKAYDLMADELAKHGLPFVAAVGAMSIWIDLREGLAEQTWEAERTLWAKLVDDHKLVLTPGGACHAKEPGYFRACYAWMPSEALPLAVRRIVSAIRDEPAAPATAAAAKSAVGKQAEEALPRDYVMVGRNDTD